MPSALPARIVVPLDCPQAGLEAVTVTKPMWRERRQLARLRGTDEQRAWGALQLVTGLTRQELESLTPAELERVAEAFASFAPAPGAR